MSQEKVLDDWKDGIWVFFDLSNYKFNVIGYGQACVDIMTLLPVASFLILNEPHDCFACLGKDPDRIYSRHQLNSEERARRSLRVRFNNTIVK